MFLLFIQAQFSQMKPLAIPSASPRMPVYPSGAPGLGQQFLYGQTPPTVIPPQVIYLVLYLTFLFFWMFG